MLFESYVNKAIIEITNKIFLNAKEYIHVAMLQNDSSPKTHNLLSIIDELTGNLSLARRQYRAAYALDPTFKPACNNLERITKFHYRPNIKTMDFGNKPELKYENPNIIQYDFNNIGHVIKKHCNL